MLHLPAPTADAIGQAVWSCTHTDISRAYRKLSVLVHPDKNPGEKARQAFEALNKAYKLLRDPNKMVSSLVRLC
jgi:curved DNA-binding protein CbpA